MSLCNKCGAVLHEEDTINHVCDSLDVPQKGIMHINGKKIDIKTKLVIQ